MFAFIIVYAYLNGHVVMSAAQPEPAKVVSDTKTPNIRNN